MAEAQWMLVYTGPTIQAQLVRATLDAAGLDTQLLDQGSTWFVGSAGMPLGRVYVDTTQAAAAATILATMKV